MSTGQMMLVIGAFAMLATLALSINGTIINTMSLSLESEMAMNAHAFAQSMLDEILTKWYDERAISTKIYNYADMTPPNRFGVFDAGETPALVSGFDVTFSSLTKFDDVDDYHRYKRKITNNLGWVFTVIDSIDYVLEDDPDTRSTGSPIQTFYKRINVYVYNDNMAKDASGNIIPINMKDFAVYRRYF